MAKDIEDAISDPSTDKDAISGSSPEEEGAGSEPPADDADIDESTPSSGDDADADSKTSEQMLEELRIENQRKQAELEKERAEKQGIWQTTQQMLAEREEKRQRSEMDDDDNAFYQRMHENSGIPIADLREMDERTERRVTKKYEAQREQERYDSLVRHDTDIRTRISEAVKDSALLSKYHQEILDEAGNSTGEERLRIPASEVVRKAIRAVKVDHFDEIEAGSKAEALKEAKENRRIRGEASSVGVVKLASGKTVKIPPQVEEFRKRYNANRLEGVPEMSAKDIMEQLAADKAEAASAGSFEV